MMLATTIYFLLDSYTRVYNHLLKMKFKIQSILGRNYFSGPKFDKSIIWGSRIVYPMLKIFWIEWRWAIKKTLILAKVMVRWYMWSRNETQPSDGFIWIPICLCFGCRYLPTKFKIDSQMAGFHFSIKYMNKPYL